MDAVEIDSATVSLSITREYVNAIWLGRIHKF